MRQACTVASQLSFSSQEEREVHATSMFSIFISSPIATVWPRADEGDSQVPSDAYLLPESNMSVDLRRVNYRCGWEGRRSGLGT